MALVAVSAPAGVMAQSTDLTRATLTHIATGFRFPGAVGGFNRVSINAFNSDATDVSISYAALSQTSSVAVTVYITPAPAVDPTGLPPRRSPATSSFARWTVASPSSIQARASSCAAMSDHRRGSIAAPAGK